MRFVIYMTKYRKNEQGISLVIVLWMLVAMTLLAFTFSQAVRTDLILSANQQNSAKSQALAEEGIWRGAIMVLNKAEALSFGQRIKLDGTLYHLESDIGRLQVSLQSVNGLIDLNHSPSAVLKALARSIGLSNTDADTFSDAVLDWRDTDDIKRPLGAEKNDYIALNLPYSAKNGLINDVSELANILGISFTTYKKLSPLVTVYSGQPRVDIESAPRQVLLGLPGLTSAMVDTIINNRNANSVDLNVIPAQYRQHVGAGLHEYIRLSSRATVNESTTGIEAVIQFVPNDFSPVTVVSWQQGIGAAFNLVN